MTTLTHTGPVRGTGGDRGVVLVVLEARDPDVHALRYAALVAAVDGRRLRVLVLVPRTRWALTTDAALLAARRRTRQQLRDLGGIWGDGPLEVDELVVAHPARRGPGELWDVVVRAARARQAATVVVPPELGGTAPRTVPGITVVTASAAGRAGGTGRDQP